MGNNHSKYISRNRHDIFAKLHFRLYAVKIGRWSLRSLRPPVATFQSDTGPEPITQQQQINAVAIAVEKKPYEQCQELPL